MESSSFELNPETNGAELPIPHPLTHPDTDAKTLRVRDTRSTSRKRWRMGRLHYYTSSHLFCTLPRVSMMNAVLLSGHIPVSRAQPGAWVDPDVCGARDVILTPPIIRLGAHEGPSGPLHLFKSKPFPSKNSETHAYRRTDIHLQGSHTSNCP
ncbi:hypothetical protein B9Z19DRAFT_1079210 [Tuber borchii]|uniref:Uncharacterized protein n=1 Tax=Tuber borchii TaxID=42251 RepID=A0A2T6ZYI9_TUBBO|nr:hypothetical protein B9Z19DRAFT_1079210 [Tuber borchii]